VKEEGTKFELEMVGQRKVMIVHLLSGWKHRSTREELGIKREKKGVEGVDHFSEEVNRDSLGSIEVVQITTENEIEKILYQVMKDCIY
jgi:hypothetical protein